MAERIRVMKKSVFTPEEKAAWDEVLFWAKRLSYPNADKHPRWREQYEAAKKRLNEIKAAQK